MYKKLYYSILIGILYVGISCTTSVQVCDGDENLDPNYDCLPYAPEEASVGEVLSDASYPIDWKDVTNALYYNFQSVCATQENLYSIEWPSEEENVTLNESRYNFQPKNIESEEGQRCYYRISACSANGCGRWSEPQYLIVGLPAPTKFYVKSTNSDVPAQDVDDLLEKQNFTFDSFQFELVWDGISGDDAVDVGLASFFIYYKENSENSWKKDASKIDADWNFKENIKTYTATIYDKLYYSKKYNFRVVSCTNELNSAGEPICGVPTREIQVHIKLGTPSDFKYDFNKGALVWKSSYGANFYKLEERTIDLASLGQNIEDAKDLPWSTSWNDLATVDVDATSGSTHEQKRELSLGYIYQYRIKSCISDAACSDWALIADPVTADLEIPQNFNFLGENDPKNAVSNTGNFTLSWDSVTGAIKYKIIEETKQADDSWGNTRLKEIVNAKDGTSYSINNQEGGKSYRFRIQACITSNVCGQLVSNVDALQIQVNLKKVQGGTASGENDIPPRIIYIAPNGNEQLINNFNALDSVHVTYKLKWLPVENSKKYVIREKQNGVIKAYYVIDDTDTTEWKAKDKKRGYSYAYEIKACNSTFNSALPNHASQEVHCSKDWSAKLDVAIDLKGIGDISVSLKDDKETLLPKEKGIPTSTSGSFTIYCNDLNYGEDATITYQLKTQDTEAPVVNTKCEFTKTESVASDPYTYQLRYCLDNNNCEKWKEFKVKIKSLNTPNGFQLISGNEDEGAYKPSKYGLAWRIVLGEAKGQYYKLVERRTKLNYDDEGVFTPDDDSKSSERILSIEKEYDDASTWEVKDITDVENVTNISSDIISCEVSAGLVECTIEKEDQDYGYRYKYTIKACEKLTNRCSQLSRTLVKNINLPVPSNLSLTKGRGDRDNPNRDGKFTINWDKVDGATYYLFRHSQKGKGGKDVEGHQEKKYRINVNKTSGDLETEENQSLSASLPAGAEDTRDVVCNKPKTSDTSYTCTFKKLVQEDKRELIGELSACIGDNVCSSHTKKIAVFVELKPVESIKVKIDDNLYELQDGSRSNYTLSWDNNLPDEIEYEYTLYERLQGQGPEAWTSIPISKDSVVVKGVSKKRSFRNQIANQVYEYGVESCLKDSNLCQSGISTLITHSVELIAPKNLKIISLILAEDGQFKSITESTDGTYQPFGDDYKLTWEQNSAQKYKIEERYDGYSLGQEEYSNDWASISDIPININAHVSSYDFTNQQGHTVYEYRVRSCVGNCDCDSGDCGVPSNIVRVEVILPVITDLKIKESEETNKNSYTTYTGDYNLYWTEPTSTWSYSFSYELAERKKGVGTSWGDWAEANNPKCAKTETTCKFTSKEIGEYQYRVSMCSDRGCGPPSNLDLAPQKPKQVSVTVKNLKAPEAPDNFFKSGLEKKAVHYATERNPLNFTWNIVNDDNGAKIAGVHYQIQWKANSLLAFIIPWPDINDKNSKIFPSSPPPPATTPPTPPTNSTSIAWPKDDTGPRIFRIRACINENCTGTGVSPWYSSRIALDIYNLEFTDSSKITNDQANNKDRIYKLYWDSVLGADSYILEESTDGSCAEDANWQDKPQGSSTTNTLITQDEIGNYCYRVKACADHDEAPETDAKCGETWLTMATAKMITLENFAESNSGTGTPSDPYVISTYDQLKTMKHDLSASYSLANDIEASDSYGEGENSYCTPYVPGTNYDVTNLPANLCTGWEPIGDSTNPFTGTFNGNGYSIKNLFSYSGRGSTGKVYAGLFGYVSSPSGDTISITNIGLKDNYILGVSSSADAHAGGLVGRVDDSSLSIANSYATGDVSSSGLYISFSGGLVGEASTVTIANSYATGVVSSSSSSSSSFVFSGGLVGSSRASIEITDSYATGDVSSSSSLVFSGGLVGKAIDSLTIKNSYATGNVSSSADAHAGGLVGRVDGSSSPSIENSYATGDVSSASHTGGLMGSSDSSLTITNSYATGDVSSSAHAGGLVGRALQSLTITNSYTTGNISSSTSSSHAGGLVGYSSSTLKIENSYAIGDVSSSASAGGLVGKASSSITIKDSYFVDSDGASNYGIGTTNLNPTISDPSTVSQESFYDLVFDMIETNDLDEDGLGWLSADWDTSYTGLPCLKNMPSGGPPQHCDVDPTGPYELVIISDYEGLKAMKDNLNASYRLAKDIEASDSWREGDSGCTPYDPDTNYDPKNPPANLCTGWKPIGGGHSNPFTGNFDGNGYRIKNLFSYGGSGNTDLVYAGFFGYVSSTNNTTVSIKNVGLKDNFILGGSSTDLVYAGGLVAYASAFTSSSSSSSSIEIANSYTTGDVSAVNRAGGLVGYVDGSSTLRIANSYATGDVSANVMAGGIVGHVYSSLTITNSYATGNISVGNSAGGLVGYSSGNNTVSISHSYATGDVFSSNSWAAGGLMGYVGDSSLTIANSYATGDVSATVDASYSGGLGGLVGRTTVSLTISNSYFVDSDGARTYGIGSTDITPYIKNVSQKSFKALVFDMVETKALASEGLAWSSTDWDTRGYGLPCLKNMPNNPLQDCGFTGSGTSANPYIIKTYFQLKAMKYDLGASYELANDIDASRSRKEGADGCTPYDPDDTNFSAKTPPEGLCTGWKPIGDATNSFTGNFDGGDRGTDDGRGYEIKNLFSYGGNKTIDEYGEDEQVVIGFFGYVSSTNNTTLSIRNIGLKDNFILGVSSEDYSSVSVPYSVSRVHAGGLVAYAMSSSNSSIEITNSYATGDVFSSAEENSRFGASISHSGGLVGGANSIEITNSYATGNVSSTSTSSSFSRSSDSHSYSGGLVGQAITVSIANSYATGDVTATSTESTAINTSSGGGLLGKAYTVSIANSYATGDVTATATSTGNVSHAGGLVGKLYGFSYSTLTITNSYATGNVSSTSTADAHAGGIVAYAELNYRRDLVITNSYATGDVTTITTTTTTTAASYSGGLVGYVSSESNFSVSTLKIENSYAIGTVFSYGYNRAYVGGLVGRFDSGSLSIENSYAEGKVSSFVSTDSDSSAGGDSYVGGLVGYSSGSFSIANSYATGDVRPSDVATTYSGGLVGYSSGSLSITKSYATGNLHPSDATSTSVAGGLVGMGLATDGPFSISYSYAIGDVTATSSASDAIAWSSSAGGLVGHVPTSIDITNSYSTGDVTATSSASRSHAGGLLGSAYNSFSLNVANSYSTGDVTAIANSSPRSYSGGLIGYTYNVGSPYSNASFFNISNSYFVDGSGGTNGIKEFYIHYYCTGYRRCGCAVGNHGCGRCCNGYYYYGVNPTISNVHQAPGSYPGTRRKWLREDLDETADNMLDWDNVLDSDGNPIEPQPWTNLNVRERLNVRENFPRLNWGNIVDDDGNKIWGNLNSDGFPDDDEEDNPGNPRLRWDHIVDDDGNKIWGNLNSIGFPCLRNMPRGARPCY